MRMVGPPCGRRALDLLAVGLLRFFRFNAPGSSGIAARASSVVSSRPIGSGGGVSAGAGRPFVQHLEPDDAGSRRSTAGLSSS